MTSQCSAMFVLLVCLTSLVSDISSIRITQFVFPPGWSFGGSNSNNKPRNPPSEEKKYYENIQYIKLIGFPGENYLQISQLVAIDVYGNNVAKGKTATASSVFPPADVNYPLDGVEACRDHESIFIAGKLNIPEVQWWMVGLRGNYNLRSISIWNRNRFKERLGGVKVQLLNMWKNVVHEFTIPEGFKDDVITITRQ